LKTYSYQIPSAVSDLPRLDAFLAEKTDLPTRSRVKRLIQDGFVLVNGRPAKPATRLHPDDQIEVRVPDPVPDWPEPEPIPLHVLYEDKHIIVIDKPAGLIVHPVPQRMSGTLVNALLHHCQDLSGIGGRLKPGIVHRLDKLTSGVMVAAKTDLAHQGLARQFKDHSIKRQYLALVHGVMEKDSGTITSLISRHHRHRLKMTGRAKHGKTATTLWRVKKRYPYFTLLECGLETGRTHQIRVHLRESRHPVVGDPLYGKGYQAPAKISPALRSAIRQLKRQALHAYLLGFVHPGTDEYLEFTSEMPADFRAVLKALEEESPKGLEDK
jgi:23S rRNA pseudouridine1911/1915/1917 synthase